MNISSDLINILSQPFPKQQILDMSFENTIGKEEIAGNEEFFLSYSVFYPFRQLYTIFIKFEIVVHKP